MPHYTVYGGSFDPIHYGHLSLVEHAIGLGYRVILVPAFRHAFGKRSAPFEHRVRMCELALAACHMQDQASVCAIERDMAQGHGGPIYTYDVLCRLRDKLGTAPCLLVGPDITAEWERWHLHRQIDQEFGRLALPLARPIRSTDIRQRLQTGIAPEALTTMMPAPVVAYIREHQLYRDETSA